MSERYDYILVTLWVMALTLGYVMVASAVLPLSNQSEGLDPRILKNTLHLMLGVIIFLVALGIPTRLWQAVYKPAMALGLLVCILVLIPGIGQIVNGSRRWIGIGPVTFQAAELTKFLAIVYLSGYLARHREVVEMRPMSIMRPVFAVGLLAGLLLLEPDFGTAVVLSLVTGGLLFVAGARLRYFLALGAAAAAVLSLVAVLQPYRLERLTSFLDPWAVRDFGGYQLSQSLIAFGRGDIFGLGLGEGISKLLYLPYAYNDFIFAVISEELGLVGSLAVIVMFALIVLRIMRIARLAIQQERNFAGLLAYGIAILLGVQSFVNIGVSIGMLPTKGLTLPFVSYGGNSLLVCCLMMGIVLRVQFENGEASLGSGRSAGNGISA